jgi:hypothetical protein
VPVNRPRMAARRAYVRKSSSFEPTSHDAFLWVSTYGLVRHLSTSNATSNLDVDRSCAGLQEAQDSERLQNLSAVRKPGLVAAVCGLSVIFLRVNSVCLRLSRSISSMRKSRSSKSRSVAYWRTKNGCGHVASEFHAFHAACTRVVVDRNSCRHANCSVQAMRASAGLPTGALPPIRKQACFQTQR